ncbi:zinc-binding alcohol dehydrogenase family protein [Limibacter armeniacum]|uniref:zinc-binding alcohol dehydrogenase family protein n=1 Tax=Limibacter armeniacum TaxID=466084 RepID=UPI002FE633F2
MKAIVLYHPGGPESFSIENRDIPTPAEGEVLVKVKAFGLNCAELMTRKGFSPDVTFPRVLGIECVGEVEEDPSGTFKKGQKVAAFMGEMGRKYDGSYAEYTVLPMQIITPFESTLSWEVLGALPEMFQTAYGSLHLALRIQPEETLLVRGGTSSVGLLATQLARQYGLQVIATTRNKEKSEFLIENGAAKVLIDAGNLAEKVKAEDIQVNKVLELVGTPTLKDSLSCVVQGGCVCMTGMLSEKWSLNEFAPMDFIPAAVYLTVYDSGQLRVGDKAFQEFIRSIERGELMPKIGKFFPFSELKGAHQFMEGNHGAGKIVLVV